MGQGHQAKNLWSNSVEFYKWGRAILAYQPLLDILKLFTYEQFMASYLHATWQHILSLIFPVYTIRIKSSVLTYLNKYLIWPFSTNPTGLRVADYLTALNLHLISSEFY